MRDLHGRRNEFLRPIFVINDELNLKAYLPTRFKHIDA